MKAENQSHRVHPRGPTRTNEAWRRLGTRADPNIRINHRYSRPAVKYDEKTNLRETATRGLMRSWSGLI